MPEFRQLTRPQVPPRVRIAAGLAFAAFTLVLSAIESLAVRGQRDFGHYELALTGVFVVAVPVALEAGALTFAGLSLWATLTGDRAPVARVMTVVSVMAASVASWTGGRAAHRPVIGAAYLAGASIVALLMWHQILHRLRREELRTAGRLSQAPPARPRFGTARWLVDFTGTRRAWKLAILEGISSAATALELARGQNVTPPPKDTDNAPLAWTELSKRQAIERAAAELGSYEPARVCAWLLDTHGIGADHSYAAKLLKRLAASRRRDVLHTVNGAAAAGEAAQS